MDEKKIRIEKVLLICQYKPLFAYLGSQIKQRNCRFGSIFARGQKKSDTYSAC